MRQSKAKYGVLAVIMVLFMIGEIAALESMPVLGLAGTMVSFLFCSAVLLFCFMKLEMMDFQEGSFWYQLNQRVNAPKQQKSVQRSYKPAASAVRREVVL